MKYKQKGHQLKTKENIKADKWDTPQISAYVFSSECKYPKGIYYQWIILQFKHYKLKTKRGNRFPATLIKKINSLSLS